MDNPLPIVVLPSRGRWGFIALLAAAVFVFFVYGIVNFDLERDMEPGQHSLLWNALPVEARRLMLYVVIAIAGYAMILAGWNCIVAPPRVIVDNDGVGGRFAGGGFVGKKRIAWNDIIGARMAQNYTNNKTFRYLVLDVNNTDGKYQPAHKWLLAIARRHKDFSSGFFFDITNAKLSDAGAREIVAIVINRAKGKHSERRESGKSPFAAD